MTANKKIAFLLGTLLLLTGVLVVLFILGKKVAYYESDLEPPGPSYDENITYDVVSKDPAYKIEVDNKSLLAEYAKLAGVSTAKGIGILSSNNSDINWVYPRKIVFVLMPAPQQDVDVYTNDNYPLLTYQPVVDKYRPELLYVYFHHNYEFSDDAFKTDTSRLGRELTSNIVSILYRITHYQPKGTFVFEERNKILSAIDPSKPILKIELL